MDPEHNGIKSFSIHLGKPEYTFKVQLPNRTTNDTKFRYYQNVELYFRSRDDQNPIPTQFEDTTTDTAEIVTARQSVYVKTKLVGEGGF